MENDREFILRLFDTVKESSNKTDTKIETMSNIVRELLTTTATPSHVDIVNKMDDLNNKLSMIDRSNVEPVHNIIECKDGIKELSRNLNILVRKVRTMITVVSVAFGLLALSYLFVSNSISNMVHDQVEVIKQEKAIDKDLKSKLNTLLEDIHYEGSDRCNTKD